MNFSQLLSLVFYTYHSILGHLNIDITSSLSINNNRSKFKNEIKFYVYTRESAVNGSEIKDDLSVIRAKRKIKLIIHGWLQNSTTLWCRQLTQILLEKDDYTIIRVDWTKLAFNTYSISAQNIILVGEEVGNLIHRIHTKNGIPLDNFHIIGHSFGAHAAGFAGQKVTELTNSKIGQITGLDASRLQFELPQKPPDGRLSYDDASIVEVVHTDAGIFGYKSPLGTVDYYPNGGTRTQPGCKSGEKYSPEAPPGTGFCSHQKSHEYYKLAWSLGGIPAYKCVSYSLYLKGNCSQNEVSYLGREVLTPKIGTYYFNIT